MTKPVVRWPAKILRTPAADVTSVTSEVRQIWSDMVDVMEAMPGVGLAAVQIGVPLRLAVVDASRDRDQVVHMANPRVVHASAKLEAGVEASPCLPGVQAEVERPRAVTVHFIDERGREQERDFVGLWARSVQHQIDHLAGHMYFDHLGRVKRDMLLRKARKGRG